jgi:hypothetical protein
MAEQQKGKPDDAAGKQEEAALNDDQLEDIAAGKGVGGNAEGMAGREPDPDRMPMEPLKKPGSRT